MREKGVRTIKVAALNIAMHNPHSPLRYCKLFKDARQLNAIIRFGKLHGIMLGSVHKARGSDDAPILTGEIYRFVNIDVNQPWFNLQTQEIASDDEVGAVVIPPHLLPHLQRIEFVFRSDIHRLWFSSADRTDKLGPKMAEEFFQRLFEKLTARDQYPEVEVTVIPDSDSLDELLSIAKIERIVIELKRPNADDGANEEIRWLKRLERQNVRKIKTELIAEKNESIEPDEDTKKMAHVAASNGAVTVVGKDDFGLPVDESTREKPMIMAVHVNSNVETSLDVLTRIAVGT